MQAIREALADDRAYLALPRHALFDRIAMTSALIEADASGTFVGSSLMFATARDWARFVLLALRDGTWNGRRILPAGWVRFINFECKYQYDNGTTDEKLPYVFRCFEFAKDCTEFILLHDGKHWENSRKGKAAVAWAKAEAVAFQNRFGKPVDVINWSGFIDWLEKEFPHQ